MINESELLDIQKHLETIYDARQLIPTTNIHLYEILKLSKISAIGTDQTIIFFLQGPILKSVLVNYTRVYPLPNYQHIFIIPPKKYSLRFEQSIRWTDEDCKNIAETILYTVSECTLENVSTCPTIEINNDYKITMVLQNNQVLMVTKRPQEVIEDCHGHLVRIFIQGIISSMCRVII